MKWGGTGREWEVGFRVRSSGKGLAAHAGSRGTVNTSHPPRVVSDLFLPLAITLGTHRQFPSPEGAAYPGPR